MNPNTVRKFFVFLVCLFAFLTLLDLGMSDYKSYQNFIALPSFIIFIILLIIYHSNWKISTFFSSYTYKSIEKFWHYRLFKVLQLGISVILSVIISFGVAAVAWDSYSSTLDALGYALVALFFSFTISTYLLQLFYRIVLYIIFGKEKLSSL